MLSAEIESKGPPIIERIEDPEQLLAQIIECLELKDSRGLKTYVLEHKLKETAIFWELILKLGECINEDACENNPGFFDVCVRCLSYLMKVGNPKETLLAVLEQMDTFIDDVKYKCFLPLLQTALQKIPSKLFHSLDITLETVSAHLRGIPMPENVQLEGEEIKMFHVDKTVVRLVDILQAFLDFLDPFVNAIDLTVPSLTRSQKEEVLVLKKHLIRVFDHPLYHLILTHDPECPKMDSRMCAEQAMKLLSRLETDFHRLIINAQVNVSHGREKENESSLMTKEENGAIVNDTDESRDNEENEKRQNSGVDKASEEGGDLVESWDFKMEVTPAAQACLAYLIHVEHLGLDKFPAIYSHEYLFQFHLDIVSNLLKNTEFPVNYKGLLLCQTLINFVPLHSLPIDYLDNPSVMAVFNDIIHVMIKCPVRDHRSLATTIFPVFLSRFQPDGRHQIYQNILLSCSHSGLKGYLVTLLKNDVSQNLLTAQENRKKREEYEQSGESKKAEHGPMACNFSGAKLQKLLKLAFLLPEGEITDMLENSDQIISSLNFLRYLVMADPESSNLTGFWKYLPTIEKDFLSPLRLGLDLSRAHYNLELDSARSGKEVTNQGPEMSVSVAGKNLPTMEQPERIALLERALNTHHIMQSLLGRVGELLDQQKI